VFLRVEKALATRGEKIEGYGTAPE
jgi:hypothetical protein